MQHGSEDTTIPEPQVNDDISAASAQNMSAADAQRMYQAYAADTRSPTPGFNTNGTTPTVTQNPLWTSQGLLALDVEALCEWLMKQGAKEKTLEVVREHQFSGEDLAYGLDARHNSASGILELEDEMKIRDQPMLCVKLRKHATKALVASREEETRHAEKWRAQQDQEAAQERAALMEERLARATNTAGPASPSVGPFEDRNMKVQAKKEKRKCWMFREHGACTNPECDRPHIQGRQICTSKSFQEEGFCDNYWTCPDRHPWDESRGNKEEEQRKWNEKKKAEQKSKRRMNLMHQWTTGRHRASQEAKDWVKEKVESKEKPELSQGAKTWIRRMKGYDETQDEIQESIKIDGSRDEIQDGNVWTKDRLAGVAEFKMPQDSAKIDGIRDEIQDEEMTQSRSKVCDRHNARYQASLNEEEAAQARVKWIEREEEAAQARVKWIERAETDELAAYCVQADKLEDYYQAQIAEKSDRFSELADEQIRMISTWLPTRHWQTILPTISPHTHKATRPSRENTKENRKDTKPASWANHDTGQEKQWWKGGQAATPVEEEWDYILDGAAAEGDSAKDKTVPRQEADWQWYGLTDEDLNLKIEGAWRYGSVLDRIQS